jgi:glycosyltransferase involved in cell wall biosynthesis
MRLTELVTPLKPLEAMAQGKLVLASDVGGHRELIRHGTNGWLFPAGDAGAFCQAAVHALKDSASWQTQKEAARRYVEEERSWFRSVSNYRSVYQSAAEAARSRVNRMHPW